MYLSPSLKMVFVLAAALLLASKPLIISGAAASFCLPLALLIPPEIISEPANAEPRAQDDVQTSPPVNQLIIESSGCSQTAEEDSTHPNLDPSTYPPISTLIPDFDSDSEFDEGVTDPRMAGFEAARAEDDVQTPPRDGPLESSGSLSECYQICAQGGSDSDSEVQTSSQGIDKAEEMKDKNVQAGLPVCKSPVNELRYVLSTKKDRRIPVKDGYSAPKASESAGSPIDPFCCGKSLEKLRREYKIALKKWYTAEYTYKTAATFSKACMSKAEKAMMNLGMFGPACGRTKIAEKAEWISQMAKEAEAEAVYKASKCNKAASEALGYLKLKKQAGCSKGHMKGERAAGSDSQCEA